MCDPGWCVLVFFSLSLPCCSTFSTLAGGVTCGDAWGWFTRLSGTPDSHHAYMCCLISPAVLLGLCRIVMLSSVRLEPASSLVVTLYFLTVHLVFPVSRWLTFSVLWFFLAWKDANPRGYPACFFGDHTLVVSRCLPAHRQTVSPSGATSTDHRHESHATLTYHDQSSRLLALIDSGAEESFLDEVLAEQLRIPTELLDTPLN